MEKSANRFILSSSVTKAMGIVGREPVDAATFIQAVFKIHDEYAGGKAASIQWKETSLKETAEEWVDNVKLLFDSKKIQSYSNQQRSEFQNYDFPQSPILHGRLLIIGICLLEPKLREQMERENIFEMVVRELKEPLEYILTSNGQKLYNAGEDKPNESDYREIMDSVPNWPDDPLLDPEQDLLGRGAFARFLAKRITAIPTNSGAYAMHVYGPWGAGKTSLMNILHKELEQKQTKDNRWLVVEFNAWRHQHIQPPWWSLMESVFKKTKTHLGYFQQVKEYWWRFNTGRLPYVVGIVLLAWVLALVVFPLLGKTSEGGDSLNSFAENAENLSKILALIATVWGSILAVNRSLLLGAAHAAQHYNELTNDPTNEIKRRFTGLIHKLLRARVAILIDDLDRCQSSYVVDLLEGIQTLFRDAPVVFVVAADRHWLNACYEEEYAKLCSRIREPGKSLGSLFLEKAFRFSTPMPGVSDELKESYWQHLLQLNTSQQNEGKAAVRENAKKSISNAKSESDVQGLVDNSHDKTFLEQRALREEAVVRLASPEILQRMEHTLKPYAKYLEPNPRSMKLLVNSYSANRALVILSEVEIELHQLALWTILSSRWPQLADYLAEYPEMLEKIGLPEISGFPDDLMALSTDPNVIQVIKSNSATNNDIPHFPLNTETLKQCSRMRS